MKVLVVGSGGREHAIIKKLSESKDASEIICAPGNGGISDIAKCFNVSATDIDGMVELAKAQKVDFVVVAPDDPLALGMVDAMEKAGFVDRVGRENFRPNIEAALEWANQCANNIEEDKTGIKDKSYI